MHAAIFVPRATATGRDHTTDFYQILQEEVLWGQLFSTLIPFMWEPNHASESKRDECSHTYVKL